MLRTFNAQIDAMTAKATEIQAAAVQAAAPQAAPMAPPQSALLPNAPGAGA